MLNPTDLDPKTRSVKLIDMLQYYLLTMLAVAIINHPCQILEQLRCHIAGDAVGHQFLRAHPCQQVGGLLPSPYLPAVAHQHDHRKVFSGKKSSKNLNVSPLIHQKTSVWRLEFHQGSCGYANPTRSKSLARWLNIPESKVPNHQTITTYTRHILSNIKTWLMHHLSYTTCCSLFTHLLTNHSPRVPCGTGRCVCWSPAGFSSRPMVPQCCNKLDKWTRRTRCRFENGIQLGLWNPNLAHQSSNLHKLDT